MANASRALGFTSLDREVENVALPLEGHLPEWLTGSLLRTGPAKFNVGTRTYTHWFDGSKTWRAQRCRITFPFGLHGNYFSDPDQPALRSAVSSKAAPRSA